MAWGRKGGKRGFEWRGTGVFRFLFDEQTNTPTPFPKSINQSIQGCKSLISMRGPDPALSQCGSRSGSGSSGQTNPDPCGSGSWSDFKVTKCWIFTRKNIQVKKHTYEVQMPFWRARNQAFFVNFSQFPYSWIRICIPNTDPDLDSQHWINPYGKSKIFRIPVRDQTKYDMFLHAESVKKFLSKILSTIAFFVPSVWGGGCAELHLQDVPAAGETQAGLTGTGYRARRRVGSDRR